MVKLSKVFMFFLSVFIVTSIVNAAQQQILVEMRENVNQNVTYNPLKVGGGIWYDTTENQSSYNISGKIVVINTNPNGKTISDIYVSFANTQNISLPVFMAGKPGTFVDNNTLSGNIILHIPELLAGENSTWSYTVNTTAIRPPLNFTSNYSDTKVLAGDNITITDRMQNVFDNYAFQPDICINNINITQVTVPINFSGVPQNYYFVPYTTTGADASNVTYSTDNKTQYWNTIDGSCLYKTNSTDITYMVSTPHNIPTTTNYKMINTTLRYNLNNTISHLRVVDIKAIGKANLSFEKKIVGPSDPVLYGSNVTWNVTGYFNTGTNISYNLTSVTFWVSKKNVNGSYTDPNTIDKDPISNATLKVNSNPYVIVNSSAPWTSSTWLFNYSDIPSPIVWMKTNFTIQNDAKQLIHKSITRNGKDLYVKELYLIIGYWLEIDKNITSIGNNSYHVRIDVHNKGNQVTPADTAVTIYDFIPSNYNLTSNFKYESSPWYVTSNASHNVIGVYNGTLFQWGVIPTNSLNTSFAAGPAKNVNTTWSVDFNVSGQGDYNVMDVYITGLDPQQVDGAGSTKAVVISEIMSRIKSTEGVFAAFASVLLLLGLLL